jgi:hypothetical protein
LRLAHAPEPEPEPEPDPDPDPDPEPDVIGLAKDVQGNYRMSIPW